MRLVRPIALLALMLVAGSASAMSLLPLDLPQLTADADRVFVGRVENVRTGRDASGLPAVWTTFTVDDRLKGDVAAQVVVKQLAATLGPVDAPVVARTGMPRYRSGETVLLFLHADSALGFTSPVGLGQGCFRVFEWQGRLVAANDLGNRNLRTLPAGRGAAATAVTGERSGAVPLDDLLAEVHALVGGSP